MSRRGDAVFLVTTTNSIANTMVGDLPGGGAFPIAPLLGGVCFLYVIPHIKTYSEYLGTGNKGAMAKLPHGKYYFFGGFPLCFLLFAASIEVANFTYLNSTSGFVTLASISFTWASITFIFSWRFITVRLSVFPLAQLTGDLSLFLLVISLGHDCRVQKVRTSLLKYVPTSVYQQEYANKYVSGGYGVSYPSHVSTYLLVHTCWYILQKWCA